MNERGTQVCTMFYFLTWMGSHRCSFYNPIRLVLCLMNFLRYCISYFKQICTIRTISFGIFLNTNSHTYCPPHFPSPQRSECIISLKGLVTSRRLSGGHQPDPFLTKKDKTMSPSRGAREGIQSKDLYFMTRSIL